MLAHLATALLFATPCPPQQPVQVPGRGVDAVRHGCVTWLLTDRALYRVGPDGPERVVRSDYFTGVLVYDPTHDRIFTRTQVHGDEAIEVHLEARNATTLELDRSWGDEGELDLRAKRKRVTPKAGAGGQASLAVRQDGGLLVITRADTYGTRESVIDTWLISPAGKVDGPRRLTELASSTSGELPVVRVAADGRALYATIFMGDGYKDPQQGMHLFALKADGTLDTWFGDGGHVVDRNILTPIAAAEVADGWLVAGGASGAYRVAVTRYSRNGGLDRSYGKDGVLVAPSTVGALEHTIDLAPLPDGRALLAGSRYWRRESTGRPTLLLLSRAGALEAVDQLELGSEPIIRVERVFAAPGEAPIVFGSRGESATARNQTSFLTSVDGPTGKPRNRPLPPAPEVLNPTAPTPSTKAAPPPRPVGVTPSPTPRPLETAPMPAPVPAAEPTIYRWVGDDGVEGFATSLDEVPPKFRAKAKPFKP